MVPCWCSKPLACLLNDSSNVSNPAVTADSCTNARFVEPATASARLVLPVPGGPQNSVDVSRSVSTRSRRGALLRDAVDQQLHQSIGVAAAPPAELCSSNAAQQRQKRGQTSCQPSSLSSIASYPVRRNSATTSTRSVGRIHDQLTNSLPSTVG